MTQGWSAPSPEEGEWSGARPRRTRRTLIAADFPGETLVIPNGGLTTRTNDLPFPFRPATDHMWLVGPTEPGSVLIIGPNGDETLYAPEHVQLGHPLAVVDPHGALYEGPRPSLSALSVRLGIATEPLHSLEARLRETRSRAVRGLDAQVDASVPNDDRELEKQLARRRLHKDEYEIAQLRETASATIEGFEAVARALPDAVRHGEQFIEGVFTRYARTFGRGIAFTPVVGGGPRATIPHWQANDHPIRSQDLLLLDAGIEGAELYSTDVARTLPVSGRYSSAQRDVYDIVHAAQLAALDATRAGNAFTAPHLAAQTVILDGLADLGVLPHPAFDEFADHERGWRWTPHGTSHMLGVDVHDGIPITTEHIAGRLEEGHVLTVEPGLYFSPFDEYVPEHLRGIGVRIEDDVVVGDADIEILTAALPTSSADVERWLADLAE